MTVSLNELFRQVILLNELDGNIDVALKFSDPDGERTGKSGWSFGIVQYDTQNNENALICLRECGFAEAEIASIVGQTATAAKMVEFAARLKAHAEVVTKWDIRQLDHCLNKALNFETGYGIPAANTAALLAGADYVNQYGSQGQGAVKYYTALARPITAKDVLNFKLDFTKYGREHPRDCKRRYANIMAVCERNGAAG